MQEPVLAPTPAPETEPKPKWRAWLPRIVAVVVLVVAVLVVSRLTFGGGEPSAAEKSAAISSELKQKMLTTLENLPAEGHQGHGGAAAAAEAKFVCGVRLYGYEPEQAKSVAEVQTVYGFHMCAAAEPKMTWFYAPKLVAPLVMRLNTNPPNITMAQSTATESYQESLKKIMPERYQAVAQEGSLEPGEMEKLQKRFEKVAG